MNNVLKFASLLAAALNPEDDYCGSRHRPKWPPKRYLEFGELTYSPIFSGIFEIHYHNILSKPKHLTNTFDAPLLLATGIYELLNKSKDRLLFAKEDEIKTIQKQTFSMISEYGEFCGTGKFAELIRWLLHKLDRHFPPIPSPEPPEWFDSKLTQQQQFIFFALIRQATIFHDENLGQELTKFMENKLEKLDISKEK